MRASNKDMPTPCQYIPMQWTEQRAAAFGHGPCGLNKIRVCEHGVGMSMFGLEGRNIPCLPSSLEESDPLMTTISLQTKGPCSGQILCNAILSGFLACPTVDGFNSATLWCCGASQVVRNKSAVRALKIEYDGQIFVWGASFENVFAPKGWPKNLQKWIWCP